MSADVQLALSLRVLSSTCFDSMGIKLATKVNDSVFFLFYFFCSNTD